MPVTFVFRRCKPPTLQYSDPNGPFPGLKFFQTKSKRMTYVFKMWPLPNSQAHFLLLSGISCPLHSSHTKLSAVRHMPYILSLHEHPEICTAQAGSGPACMLYPRGTVSLTHIHKAIRSLFPNSPNSCHCCYLSQKLRSRHFLSS